MASASVYALVMLLPVHLPSAAAAAALEFLAHSVTWLNLSSALTVAALALVHALDVSALSSAVTTAVLAPVVATGQSVF